MLDVAAPGDRHDDATCSHGSKGQLRARRLRRVDHDSVREGLVRVLQRLRLLRALRRWPLVGLFQKVAASVEVIVRDGLVGWLNLSRRDFLLNCSLFATEYVQRLSSEAMIDFRSGPLTIELLAQILVVITKMLLGWNLASTDKCEVLADTRSRVALGA